MNYKDIYHLAVLSTGGKEAVVIDRGEELALCKISSTKTNIYEGQ